MKYAILFFAASIVAGAPTLLSAAQDWQTGITRGLPTYSVSADGGSLVIACDPDRVYNPDISYANFGVSMPRDQRATQIVFLSNTGQQAAFDVRDGMATQQNAHPEDWTNLVEMIRQGGTFAVVTARDTFSLDMDAMPDFRCQ